MKISEICIDRPVFATVLSLVIVLLGLVSFSKLTVREYPQTDSPVVSVQTTYSGASAEIMESQVTQVLEEALSGIDGIDYMTSSSQQGRSNINIIFNLNRDPDSAAADVRDRVSRTRGRLPMDVDEPIIAKVEADSQPILFVVFSSDRMSAMELSDFVDRYVLDQLRTVPGVATINQIGERKYSMRIWLDAERLAAYGVTPQDVATALRQQNVEVPAGLVEGKYREYSVLTETDLKTPEEFNNLVIRKTDSGYLVRLIDVGRAELGPEDERFALFHNDATAYGLGVTKQATANPLDISNAVRQLMPRIRASLPPGMTANVIVDFSRSIKESIKNVYETIAEAIVLVIAVIFLFLRSMRATLVPLITIPVSLIGAVGLMYLLGFSINTLTLLAMVLAIGLVVDDAIVMLENIYRHVEDGMKPLQAAKTGAAEMGFAVVAMSLTLAAVYVPVSFMGGTSGRLFTEFAITLAAAVLISGFVALTASPMMCSKLLKSHEKHGRTYQAMENFFNRVTNGYRSLLAKSLKRRAIVLAIGGALAALGVVFFLSVPTELAPIEDGGNFPIFFQGPEGSTIEYSEKYGRQIQAIADTIPEAETIMMVIGFGNDVTSGRVFVELKPWSERSRTPKEIIPTIMGRLRNVAGVNAFPILSPPLGGGRASKPISVVVQTPLPFEELQKMTSKFVDALQASGKFTALDTDLRLDKPQVKIDVDRDKAADLGIDAQSLGQTLGILVGGQQITRFKREGQEYDVIVRLTEPFRTSPGDLPNIYVRAAQRPARATRQSGEGDRDGLAPKPEPLRSAPVRHDYGQPCRWRLAGAGIAGNSSIGENQSADHSPTRIYRSASGVLEVVVLDLRDLRSRDRVHLSGSRRPVRKLPQPVHHPADGTALDRRRVVRALGRGREPQYLQPGRPDHAHRPHYQARHSDRRVLESEPRIRHEYRGCGDRRGDAASAPDSHDHGRDGVRRDPARPGAWRGCGQPAGDRPRDRRRSSDRHVVHTVRHSGGLYAVRRPQDPP